ncbi:MAG: acyl-CoA dehydrogenase family protein [Bdellovibrionota bacterium]
MNKENFLTDNPDILFHLEKRTDVTTLFEWTLPEDKEILSANTPDEYRKIWLDMLEGYGEFCGSVVASSVEQVEKEDLILKDGEVQIGPTMKGIVDGLLEMGIPALSIASKYDGLGAPFFVEMVTCEIGNRACPSMVLNAGWWGPIAHIIEQFGSEELKSEYIPRIASGEFSGNMALTEAGAGSDLAAIRTYGEEQADGSWILNGSKQFISNGNSQVSLVLAMNKKGATSLSDLSLYLCPSEVDGKKNIHVTKIEEKVGLHGSATCELLYKDAKAYLLGESGKGFKYMLRLMNDARIAVGFQGLGLMEATLRLAKDYASQRKTWDKPIAQHELIAEKLLDLEVETRGFRSLCYQAAQTKALIYAGEKFLQANPDLSKEKREEINAKLKKYNSRVRRWTPLIKYIAGEQSFRHARTALQIHGGYGFTKEYRAEWWVRESLIYSLYEGTSQIQALMCMKDTLKEIVAKPKDFFESAFGLKVKALSHSDPIRKKLYKMKEEFHKSVMGILFRLVKSNVKNSLADVSGTDLIKMVKRLRRDLIKFDELRPALLHAERICEMKSLIAVAEAAVWDIEDDPERSWIAERLVNTGLPRISYLHSEIDMDDPIIEGILDRYAQASKES